MLRLENANRERIEELAETLASKTDGYTGAEISLVCRESALIALQDDINCINVEMMHYELALKKVKRRLSNETIAKYKNFENNLKYWFCISSLLTKNVNDIKGDPILYILC